MSIIIWNTAVAITIIYKIQMAEKEKNGSTCLSWVTVVPLHHLKTVHVNPEDTAASPG